MSFKLNSKLDLYDLDGKSGKLYVNERHIVFESRDGVVSVLATAVHPRALKVGGVTNRYVPVTESLDASELQPDIRHSVS